MRPVGGHGLKQGRSACTRFDDDHDANDNDFSTPLWQVPFVVVPLIGNRMQLEPRWTTSSPWRTESDRTLVLARKLPAAWFRSLMLHIYTSIAGRWCIEHDRCTLVRQGCRGYLLIPTPSVPSGDPQLGLNSGCIRCSIAGESRQVRDIGKHEACTCKVGERLPGKSEQLPRVLPQTTLPPLPPPFATQEAKLVEDRH